MRSAGARVCLDCHMVHGRDGKAYPAKRGPRIEGALVYQHPPYRGRVRPLIASRLV